MKKATIIMISILIVLLGMLFAVRDGLALDPPHNPNDPSWSVTCSRCHFSPSGPTPSWATYPTTTESTMNLLCFSCHQAGKLTTSKYEDVKSHSAANTGSTDWGGTWTTECIDCHSPHSQQQQVVYAADPAISLVTGTVTRIVSSPTATQSSIGDSAKAFTPDQYAGYLLIPNTAYPSRIYRIKSNSTTTLTVAGAINLIYAGVNKPYAIRYGKMVNNAVKLPGTGIATVEFFKDTGEKSFATGTNSATSVCLVCHTQTMSFNRDGTLEAGSHPQDTAGKVKCTVCHEHGKGFKIGGCTGCHGNPPNSTATLVYSTANGSDPARTTGQTTPGAHVAHVNSQGIPCTMCHVGGMPSPEPISSTSRTLQIGFGSMPTGTSVTYYKRTEPLANSYTYNTGSPNTILAVAPTASLQMGCASLYCHSDVQADGGSSGPSSYATVTWSMTSANVQCGSCHKADGAQGLANLMSTGSHTKHLSTAAGYPAASCNDCHSGNSHGDGLIDVTNTSYSQGTHSPGSGGYGTCTAAACHDNGINVLVETPIWGTDTPACTACHYIPTTGSHTIHLSSGVTSTAAVCANCHKNAVIGVTPPAEHLDQNIDIYTNTPGDLGYPVNKTKCTAPTSCSTAACHDNGRGALVTTPDWGTGVADCSVCHQDTPSTGSHLAHVASTSMHLPVCADCHNGAVNGVGGSVNKTIHHDENIDVYAMTPGDLGYPQNKTKNTAYASCSTVYCHSSGQSSDGTSTTPYSYGTPTWDNPASGACNTCHPVTTPAVSTGSHTSHMAQSGVGCDSCHLGATTVAYDQTTHVDGSIDVGLGSYTAGTTRGNGYGMCSTATCHDNGLGVSALTPTWGYDAASCTACHALQPSTGSHTKHLVNTLYAKPVCGDCHDGTVQGTTAPTGHLNDNVDVYDATAGDLGYPATVAKHNDSNYSNCSTAYCHSSGQSSDGTSTIPYSYATVTWGSTAICGSCHPTTLISTGSHTWHLNVSGVSCDDCHAPATTSSYNSTLHVNREINLSVSYTLTTPGDGYGSCGATMCHGTNSSTWGANTSTAQCTKCHGQSGTAIASYTLKNAAPGFTSTGTNTGLDTGGLSAATGTRVGAHQVHLATTAYHLAFACTECHKVPASLTASEHIDSVLPAEITGQYSALASFGAATMAYNYGTATCTNLYCHDGGFFKNGGAWSNGTDTSPTWNNTAYLNSTPTNSGDCSKCHGYPPATGGGLHPNDSNCASCHKHVSSVNNISFMPQGSPEGGIELHVNGQVEGGDACLDCHSGLLSGAGSHNQHTSTTVLASKSISSGDYGTGTWWFSYSNTGGAPNASCGYCHPSSTSTHKDGAKSLYFAPTDTNANIAGTVKARSATTQSFTQNPGVAVVCGSTYCHSNGYSPSGNGLTNHDYGYANSPEWYAGVFGTDKCAGCHTNSPSGSAAHTSHTVGIHYTGLFTGGVGTMVTGNTGTNSHGSAAYSTTVNCNLCHVNTVTMSANALSSQCLSCHSDTNTPATGNDNLVIAPTSTYHVDGNPNIFFSAITFKSKAQLRGDITTVAELNTTWSRTTGYKVSGSYDSSKNLLSTASYSSVTRGCTNISCHNGYSAVWTNPASVTCSSCHTDLAQ